LYRHFRKNSIAAAILYPLPVHLQPAYENKICIAVAGLPVTEEICGRILSLPMYPQMTDAQVNHVVEAILTLGDKNYD
jgi:dTDP-4-amino-4,6-dideoxygalactose transaminase